MNRLPILLLAAALACMPALAALAADAGNGGRLFKRYCAGCHGPDGRGGGQTFMPHIENLTKRGYIDQVPDEYLIGVINDGGPSVGKSSYMPAWRGTLSESDVLDVVAYIRSLPTF